MDGQEGAREGDTDGWMAGRTDGRNILPQTKLNIY